jgi:hypothetical protein
MKVSIPDELYCRMKKDADIEGITVDDFATKLFDRAIRRELAKESA